MSTPKYWTVEDTAAEFCVSEATIYRGIKHGKIPALRIMSTLRIPASWIEKQTATFGPVIEDVHHDHKIAEPVQVTLYSDGRMQADFDLEDLLSHMDGRGCE